jgi:hypothetical protein
MLPTTLEEREGGYVAFHMGETSSEGTVTGWDPPRRLAYEEPGWPELHGQTDAVVTPLATEFLVEAKAGGTCIVRVVSSAFGTGADWEEEFFESMAEGWRPSFEVLRLYLADFPGQQATDMWLEGEVERPAAEVRAAMAATFAVTTVGAPAAGLGAAGVLVDEGAQHLTLRLSEPVPGVLVLMAIGNGEKTWASVHAYLFSPDAEAWVAREEKGWRVWLEGLGTLTP